MSIDILKQKLKEKNISGAFLFYGEEEYTKDYYISELKGIVESAPAAELNFFAYDAPGNASEITDIIDAPPVMAEHKLIYLRLMPSQLKDDDIKEYTEIINNLPDYCCLLMCCRAYELDEKQSFKGKLAKLRDAAGKNGLVCEFKKPDTKNLKRWIERHFKSYGASFDPDAAERLIQLCGDDMYILASEIEKLCMSGKKITAEAADRICCANESCQVYDLSKEISAGNVKAALKILELLEKQKTEPTLIFGLLTKHFTELALIKAGLDCSAPIPAIAQRCGIQEWLVRRQAAFLPKLSGEYLKKAAALCAEADARLKGSPEPPYTVLQLFVLRLSGLNR